MNICIYSNRPQDRIFATRKHATGKITLGFPLKKRHKILE